MSTLTRAESARANGAKSRGPITPEGKAKSSRNAVRHGLTIKAMVLPAEDREAAAAVLADYTAKFEPADPVEHELVEALALARWKSLRADGIEHGYFNNATARFEDAIDNDFESADPRSRAAEAFRHMVSEDASFRTLIRYQREIRVTYSTTLRELRAIQSDRRKAESHEDARPEAQPEAVVEITPPESRNEPRHVPQTPRNAPCPCGSGTKFKRCCGLNAPPVLGPGSEKAA